MEFLAPAFLYGLPAVSIPVVIYLIFRRRRRDVRWGAIYILRRVLESRSRAAAWVQYLILALRTVALLLLVLLFASPYRPWTSGDKNALPPAPPATHRIVLLDVSGSMGARYGPATAGDAALALCRDLAAATRAPGIVEILPADGRRESFRFDALPPEEQALERSLADASLLQEPLSPGSALRAATESFRMSPFDRRELFWISDFNAADFTDDEGERVRRQCRVLSELGVRIAAVRLREEGIGNVAITDLSTVGDAVLADQPALFRFELAYAGDKPAAETRLRVTDGAGKELHAEVVSVGETKRVEFPLSLPGGRHEVTASLTPDGFEADDTMNRSFVSLGQLHVMLLQNLTDRKGFDNPRTWLELAFAGKAPEAKAGGTNQPTSAAEAYRAHSDAIQAEREAASVNRKPYEIILEGKIPEQINDDLLSLADMVVVLEVDDLSDEARQAVEGYVLRGGTVLLAPGPETNAEAFRRTFASLSPAALGAMARKAINPAEYEQCLVEAGQDRLLRQLESPEHGNLAAARFYNWYSCDVNEDDGASKTLLSLSDGSPLLAERALGRGRVLLWTAGLGSEWHSMGVHPAYAVLMIQMVRQAAARKQFPANLEPGQPLLAEASGVKAKVVRPDGEAVIVDTVAVGDRRLLRYDNTDRPGVYDVRFDVASERPGLLFHVGDDRSESNLRPLGKIARADLEAAWDAPLLDGAEALRMALASAYPGRRFDGWAGLAAVLCLVAGAALARRFFA